MAGIRSLKKISGGSLGGCFQLELTETLCHVRLEIARCNTTPDYQVEEVQNAVKELKLGKSVDPAGLIREVFIRGGSGFINSIITAVFNAFKKNFDAPGQWDEMFITTFS